MPPQPYRDSPQGYISVVCAFGLVVGGDFEIGGGAPPRPRKLYYYVFAYIFYIIATLELLDSHVALARSHEGRSGAPSQRQLCA